MMTIPYQMEKHRALMWVFERDVSASVSCAHAGARDVIPASLRIAKDHHRTYRMGAWFVEPLQRHLFVQRNPHQAHLPTEVRIDFERPENIHLIYVNQSEPERALRQVTSIVLGETITVVSDDIPTPEAPVMAQGAPTPRQTLSSAQEQELLEEIERLRRENRTMAEGLLDERLAALTDQLAALTEGNADKLSHLRQLEAEYAGLQARQRDLETQIRQTQEQMGVIRLSIEELEDKLRQYQAIQVEAHAANQLVEIDTEATMEQLRGLSTELLCTRNAAALMEQSDVVGKLDEAQAALELAKETVTNIIRVREQANEQVRKSLRRKPQRGEQRHG